MSEAAPSLKKDRTRNITARHKQWPKADQVRDEMVSVLRAARPDGVFDRSEAQQRFKQLYTDGSSRIYRLASREAWVDHFEAGQPSIEEVMFSLGCLGFLDHAGAKQFPWSNRPIDEFNAASKYFVGDLFMLSDTND